MPVARIASKCPRCKKKVQEVRFTIQGGKYRVSTLECGHTQVETLLAGTKVPKSYKLKDMDGNQEFFDYQAEDLQRVFEEANGRALIRWSTGTGKTLIPCGAFRLFPDEMLPAVVFCKRKAKEQWFYELNRWCDLVPQVFDQGFEKPLKAFKVYILGLDMARRVDFLNDEAFKGRIKTVVIDEVQLIKNTEAQRTQQVINFCDQAQYVLELSGTPIENHAGEYFVPLHILRPQMFPEKKRFYNQHVNWRVDVETGREKPSGLSDPKWFHELTKTFIFHRRREDVLPQLPKIFRQFNFVDLGEYVQKKYQDQVDGMIREIEEGGGDVNNLSFEKWSNVMGYLSRMRHIVGIAKTEPAVEYVADHLMENDRKILVFCYHHDVHRILVNKIGALCKDGGFNLPLQFTAGMKQEEETRFTQNCARHHWPSNDPKDRVLIASTAGGESINLQAAADLLQVERMWTPSKELQMEGRLPRICKEAGHKCLGAIAAQINSMYLLAQGTVDEMLTEYVEQKRRDTSEAMQDPFEEVDETAVMRTMAKLIFESGREGRWRAM